MLILITDVFSSPVGPCGSESSVWSRTFSFLCQSSGKGSYTGVSSFAPTSTVTMRRKHEPPAGLKCRLKWNSMWPQYELGTFFLNIHFRYVSIEITDIQKHNELASTLPAGNRETHTEPHGIYEWWHFPQNWLVNRRCLHMFWSVTLNTIGPEAG